MAHCRHIVYIRRCAFNNRGYTVRHESYVCASYNFSHSDSALMYGDRVDELTAFCRNMNIEMHLVK